LVVSNNSLNNSSDDCILLPLTSAIKNVPYSILITKKDLLSGNLLKDSRIRADKIFTLEKNKIFNKIGILNDNIFKKVYQKILRLF